MSSSAGGNPLEHLLYEVHILIPEIENKEGIWPLTKNAIDIDIDINDRKPISLSVCRFFKLVYFNSIDHAKFQPS